MKPSRLSVVLLLTVILPVAGLAALGARSIAQEEALLGQREAQRADELARSVRDGLRLRLLDEARRANTRLREALAAGDELDAAVASPGLGIALVVDDALAQVAPRRAWRSEGPDLPPVPGDLLGAIGHEQAGRYEEALTSLDALGLDKVPAARNLRARILRRLGRHEQALAEDAWLSEQPATGGLPLSWIASERRIETLLELGRRDEAGAAVMADLQRVLGGRGGQASPGAALAHLARLVGWGERLSAPADLLGAARERRREAQVAAELSAWGALDQVADLDALDGRFALVPSPTRGLAVIGPASQEAVSLGGRRIVLAAEPEDLAAAVETLARERSGADRDSFAVALSEVRGEGVPLTRAERLWVRAAPTRDAFSTQLAGRRTMQRISVLGLLVVLVAAGSWATVRAIRRSGELARARNDFVASVTHELRTPVTSIRAMAETLSLGKVTNPDRQSFYFGAIAEETQRLGRLIEDVLTVSRVEREGFTVTLERAEPTPVIEHMIETFRASPVAKDVEVTFDPGADLPLVLWDERLVERALFNLLGNAVKYGGEEPGIRVELRRSGGGLAIAVVDQGPGIPREEQGRILLPFERGADALESRKPGAGLGLAIVNAIVSSQGGRLSLKSEPGQGCRFEVWLPGAKE